MDDEWSCDQRPISSRLNNPYGWNRDVAMVHTVLRSLVVAAAALIGVAIAPEMCRAVCCGACGGGIAGCACEVCCPTIEQTTQEKSQWKVECEKVCIPAVRLPWEPGGSKLTLFSWWTPKGHDEPCRCAHGIHQPCETADCARCGKPRAARCGKVRAVSVLEEESREVTVCKCKWEIRRLPTCCPTCDHGAESSYGTKGPTTTSASDCGYPLLDE